MVTTRLLAMGDTPIRAGDFKARCLALLDEVAETRRTLVVTKRGRPVARVVPLDPPGSLVGSLTVLVDDDELLFSTGEGWDVDG